jgi:nickel-type superoxide dismutase maturation protease
LEGLSPAGTKELLLWILRLRRRVRVRGESMLPHLRSGDEVLVDPYAYRRNAPRPGEIVLAQHPYQRDLKLVKRVEAVLEGDRYRLRGDNPSQSTDSRTFGNIPRGEILGRVTSIFSRSP